MTSRAKRILSASGLAMVLTAMSSAAAFATPASPATQTPASTATTAAPASVDARIGARVVTCRSKITVTRTAADALRVNWPKRAGATSYVVIASGAAGELASATTRATAATITDLKTTTRYTFIVTPMKGAVALKPMRAVMVQGLNGGTVRTDVTATTADAPAVVDIDAVVEPQIEPQDKPENKPAATPSAPAGSDSSSSAPSTPTPPRMVTVWECPAGYAEQSDGTCTQTRSYTYQDVTTAQGYTYHAVFVVTGHTFVGVNRQWDGACIGGTDYGDRCGYYQEQGYNTQVKDAAPAGFGDDGSQWVRTETVRDAAPDGFGDDGSQWVRTAAKVSREIPA